jgi:hypothetical protein
MDMASMYQYQDPMAGPDVMAQGTGQLSPGVYAGSDRALFMIAASALAVLWILGGYTFKQIRM